MIINYLFEKFYLYIQHSSIKPRAKAAETVTRKLKERDVNIWFVMIVFSFIFRLNVSATKYVALSSAC